MATWKKPTKIQFDDDSSYAGLSDEEETNPNGCEKDHLTAFIKALPKCVAAGVGFHPGCSGKSLCWCPCSVLMSGWRKEYNVDEILVQFEPKPCEKGSLTPEGFIAHLKHESRFCAFHCATLAYFETYLCKEKGERLGLNVGHWTMYGKGDEKHKKSKDNEVEFCVFRDKLFKQRELDEELAKKAAASAKLAENDVASSNVNVTASVAVIPDNKSVQDEIDGRARRAISRRLKQKNNRTRKFVNNALNVESITKTYTKILVVGMQFTNPFTKEYESRVEECSSNTSYKAGIGRPRQSKDVCDAIRGHFLKKQFPDLSVSSVRYPYFNTSGWLKKLNNQVKGDEPFDGIFLTIIR